MPTASTPIITPTPAGSGPSGTTAAPIATTASTSLGSPTATPYVTAFERGEWMQYTLDAAAAGLRARTLIDRRREAATLSIRSNDGTPVTLAVPAGGEWKAVPVPPLAMLQGTNRLKWRSPPEPSG